MSTPATSSQWLEEEYLKRRRKNAAYSLRAFSRLLDLPSGRVSQLLSRKRSFTPKLGQHVARQLGYDPRVTSEFLALIDQERGRRRAGSPMAAPTRELAQLPMDQFEAIADPLHFAILSLLETKNFSGHTRDIGAALGRDGVEARAAAERLERLGLVHTDKNGRLKLSKSPGLATSHDVQNAALRRAHRSVLEDSLIALEEIPVGLRDITSITMAIDPARLPAAKEKLREMRRQLSDFLESGSRTEVYRLNVQLVPVKKGRQ
jgi:uncharacterized protein (TIGR02147 family)